MPEERSQHSGHPLYEQRIFGCYPRDAQAIAALQGELRRLITLLHSGARDGETPEIRAWCWLALDGVSQQETPGISTEGLLVAERDSLLEQLEAQRPVVEAAIRLGSYKRAFQGEAFVNLQRAVQELSKGETGAQPSVGTTRATCDLGPTASTDSPTSNPASDPDAQKGGTDA